MELLVVRHAIAFEPDARRWPDDADRPLSPRGIARASRAAAGLKRLTERPVQVLSSPLHRALETAAILTRFAGWPEAAACDELRPGVASDALLARLARVRGERIALIGHQPGLGRLIAACVPGSAAPAAFALKKMSVGLLGFPGAVRAARGELLWLLPPKVMRAAG